MTDEFNREVNYFHDVYIKDTNKKGVIMLNGRWGSGKTYFLNKVREKDNDFQYIDLDFWGEEILDQNFMLIAKKIKPAKYYCQKYNYLIMAILISAIVTFLSYIFSIGDSSTSNDFSSLLSIFLFFLLIAALLQLKDYFSNTTILEDKYKSLLEDFSDPTKIIVIDDFDRISFEDRRSLYSIINLLKSKGNKIIIVGDIIEIDRDIREGFVRKIIDYRYDIDNLHSSEFLFSKIEHKLQDINVDTSSMEIIRIRMDFKNKKRTYRDYEQFSSLLEDHVLRNNNLEYINSEEKVYLLYIYHFYYEVYDKVLSYLTYEKDIIPDLFKDKDSDDKNDKKEMINELENKFHLDHLLDFFISNTTEKNLPSLYHGYHDLYLIGNGKNFSNIQKAIERSEKLDIENFKNIEDLDPQSLTVFTLRSFRLIRRMSQEDTRRLVNYLNQVVLLIFEEDIYLSNGERRDVLLSTIYELKKFTKSSDVLKEWYKKTLPILDLNQTYFLMKIFDSNQSIVTPSKYKEIVQSKYFSWGPDNKSYGILFLLQKYDEKRFYDEIQDIIKNRNDEKFYNLTRKYLVTISISNRKEILHLYNIILSSNLLVENYLKRVEKVGRKDLREELESFYSKAKEYNEYVDLG